MQNLIEKNDDLLDEEVNIDIISNHANGININHECGSLNINKINNDNHDFLFSFDGAKQKLNSCPECHFFYNKRISLSKCFELFFEPLSLSKNASLNFLRRNVMVDFDLPIRFAICEGVNPHFIKSII